MKKKGRVKIVNIKLIQCNLRPLIGKASSIFRKMKISRVLAHLQTFLKDGISMNHTVKFIQISKFRNSKIPKHVPFVLG